MKAASNNNARGRHADPVAALTEDIAAIKRDMTALIGGRLGAVSDRTKEFATQTKERAEAAHEQLGEIAGSNPVRTIVLAAVAGAVGAKLLSLMLRR